jgi:hypothetical protein
LLLSRSNGFQWNRRIILLREEVEN